MVVLIIGACGYVGSAVYKHLKSKGHEVDAVDLELRGNPGIENRKTDYRRVSHLKSYDAIVWLAGHSSVGQSRAQPVEAFDNNLVGLVRLATKLTGQPLIYASSASVYAIKGGRYDNMYDLTKHAGDAALRLVYNNAFGLRFGTVCGVSPNMRWDVMVNGMVRDAVTKGTVYMRNPEIRRPILGMHDLCTAIEVTLNGNLMPGCYNVSSFSGTVGSIAHKVAAMMCVPVEELGGEATPAYDFEMPSSFIPRETLESIVDEIRQLVGAAHDRPVAGRSDQTGVPAVPSGA